MLKASASRYTKHTTKHTDDRRYCACNHTSTGMNPHVCRPLTDRLERRDVREQVRAENWGRNPRATLNGQELHTDIAEDVGCNVSLEKVH